MSYDDFYIKGKVCRRVFNEKFAEESALYIIQKNQLDVLQSNKTEVSLGPCKIMAKMK